MCSADREKGMGSGVCLIYREVLIEFSKTNIRKLKFTTNLMHNFLFIQ
jgi:hypothetical protein